VEKCCNPGREENVEGRIDRKMRNKASSNGGSYKGNFCSVWVELMLKWPQIRCLLVPLPPLPESIIFITYITESCNLLNVYLKYYENYFMQFGGFCIFSKY
jgi:hypothetical protein